MLIGPLLWLLAPLVITAVFLWLRRRQASAALAGQPLTQVGALITDDPSAFELLRRRYVVGEIDAPTFAAMTERLLISERAEELNPPAIRSARHDRHPLRDANSQRDSYGPWDAGQDDGVQPEPARITWL